jgi:diguanylate cyclase (GGDEF)-like protein/PAS domain S-box-containing protein/putative nucleotidyltransferase with HDIG domain
MFRIFGREEEFAPTWDEYLALCHPDDRAAVAGRVAGTQPGGSAENEYRIVRPDGEVRTVHGRSDRRVGEDGMPARLFGTIQDITDRKRAELELARERDHTAAIVSAMSEGYMLAVDERIAVVNDALCALTGFRRAELVGAGHPYPFAPRGVSGQALAVRESTVAAGGGTAQLTLMRRDGTRVEAEITSRAARNPDGSVLGFVTTVRDISAQKRHEAELTRLADHDPLTGLANHRAFHERLDAEITRARRRDRPLGVCIFDLDHFKHVNDHHGHLAGDQVLHAVAERLAALVADGQLLARVGGEEFAWILPGVEGVELFAAAERTRQAIAAAPIEPVGELTLSAGVCDLAHAGESSELYPRADEALYWAKAHGRNRTFRYSTDTADEMLASEARLADQRRTLLAHLSELARSADQRHPHFADHATAVASLSVVLATHAGWSPEDIESLRVAALLHDLGKVAVPESIIAKAGSLTETERAQLRTHAAIGAEMVAAALTPAQVSWIRHHHEHWDGAGYPDRLARSAIPEGAQLIALADAFDAMTSARPYREALTMEMAILEIHAGAGTQCAPHAVALFDAALPAVRSSRGG